MNVATIGRVKVVTRRRGSRLELPDIRRSINNVIKDYMPRAASLIKDRARSKMGIYQPGWKPLSPDTLARKRRRKLVSGTELRFKRIRRRPAAGIGDTPLVDRGRMAGSVRARATGNRRAVLTVGFPMGIHEQDSQYVEAIRQTRHTPPRRPLMVPSLKESMPTIISELTHRAGLVI